jgi:hypothetical protein
MNNLSVKKLLIFLFTLTLTIGAGNAQIFHKNPEKQLFGKSDGSRKGIKVKEPRSVLRAKKKQEANKRRLDKEYEKSVKQSQKRTVAIQTPEVQDRMKQNKKDSAIRDKEKKKKVKSSSKRAGKKYK